MPLVPNQQLFEYHIVRILGQGAFGTVYLAHDTLLDRPVAIKELTVTAQTDEVAFKRFLQEARAAGGLSHPHIVTVHALKVVEPEVYLVMEAKRLAMVGHVIIEFETRDHTHFTARVISAGQDPAKAKPNESYRSAVVFDHDDYLITAACSCEDYTDPKGGAMFHGDIRVCKHALAAALVAQRRRLGHLPWREMIGQTTLLKVVESNVYLVMEYLAGGSLRTLLEKRGPLPAEAAVRITADVCEDK